MKRTLRYYRLVWFRSDLAAGLSVFLVALPLCLGIALASGAPLYAGLLSGIIGGIVVASISGSPLAVSGPAAGLTTLVASGIAAAGDYRVFLLTVVIAGLFQLVLGLLRLGAIANYFPSAVIKGMLAAIGIILIGKQLPIALGYDQPDFWRSGFLSLFSYDNFAGNLAKFGNAIAAGALLITIVSLLIMAGIQHAFTRSLRAIPAPLMVVLAGAGIQLLLQYSHASIALTDKQLVHIPPNIFNDIRFPDLSQLFSSGSIWKTGLQIGLLASLETLLCIEAVDKLDRHNRITPVNRELVAQGIGNIVCGMLGAIPLTAVVVRGAANVDAGARTKLSAITHGVFLLLAVVFIPFLLNYIPYACLAGILLVTGYNLARPKLFKNMWSLGRKQFLPFLLTIIVILATDLLVGVSIGLLLSVFFIIQNNFKAEYKLTATQKNGRDILLIRLNSNVTFLNKVKLKKALDEVPEHAVLTIDGSACNFIDYDILEIISEFDTKAQDRHIELHLEGIRKVNVTAVH